MSRSIIFKRDEKKKDLNPIWRGVGCLLFVVVFAISYAVSWFAIDYVGRENMRWQIAGRTAEVSGGLRALRGQFEAQMPWVLYADNETGARYVTGDLVLPALSSLVVALFVYALATLLWGYGRGYRVDPRDVRTSTAVQRKKKIRRCR